jgi:peptide/nickel transport system permease protein
VRRVGPGAYLGAVLVLVFVVVAIVGPAFAPFDPDTQNLANLLHSPGPGHWLGTDENGCDLLSEILYGARLAAAISGATVLICLSVGTTVGTLAGYAGGWVDDVIMRIVDVLLAFPGILLNLTVAALMPRTSAFDLVFILSLNGWVGYARVARGQALALRERDFVQAARAIGCSPLRIAARHLVPNLLSPLIIQASFGFAGIILVEASLSFLGLGPQHAYSWGALLNQGTTYLWRATYLAAAPGVAIAIVVLGFNLLGDGLRDALDPRRTRG